MSVRKAAVEILSSVLHSQIKADVAMERHGSGLPERDHALLHEMAYGALRCFYSLEADYSRFCKSKPDPVAQAALLLGTYQLRQMRIPEHAALSETVSAVQALQPKAAGFVNAVLRRVSESSSPSKLKPYQRSELPKWIYAAWRDAFGAEEVQQLCHALRAAPKLSLALFVDRDAWLVKARSQGFEALPGKLSPHAVLLPSGTSVTSLPGFSEGEFAVMDQAAQAAVMALEVTKPDGLILDVCAAPGGKTALLSHRFPEATILAVELNSKRIPRLRGNLARTGCHNVTVVQADGFAPPLRERSADAVMLDAPCSASGVLRRHPDARFLHDQKTVEKLAAGQKLLLQESLRLLKPDGEMIYAVCSIHPQENELVVDSLSQDSNRLLPSEDHDGFFFARIRGGRVVEAISECDDHE